MSRHGVHVREQTAFRLPPDVLARLRGQAEREQRTMTDIVADAIAAYLARTEGAATAVRDTTAGLRRMTPAARQDGRSTRTPATERTRQ